MAAQAGSGRAGADAGLDIFNVTNQGRATEVEDRVGPNLGEPETFNAPRNYRLGVRFLF